MGIVVGEKSRFAIEYQLDLRYGGVWLYGAFCYWIADERVGDFEAGTSLRDALFQIEQVLKGRGRRDNDELAPWRVIGLDTFAGEEYRIAQYTTEAEAEAKARDYLEELERTQPTAQSGGQTGIQDRVYVVGPGGSRRRVL